MRRRRPGRARPPPDRTRRHAEQVAARRQRDAGGVDGRRACRRRGAPASRCIATSAAPTPTLLPLPQIQIFGGGAHAGRRVDIQDFMVVCPGATSFAPGAGLDRRGLPRRRRADAGARHAAPASPTKAAGGPPSPPTSRRSRRWSQAIERAGFAPGAQVAIALDVAASEFGRGGSYKLGAGGQGTRQRRHDRAAAALDRHAIRSSRSRIRWPRTTPRASRVHPRGGRAACRSSATTSWSRRRRGCARPPRWARPTRCC